MSDQLRLEYSLVQQGQATLVKFRVGGEFIVPSLTPADARAVLAALMARLTGRSVEEIQHEWASNEEAELWLGGSWRRPVEPDSPGSAT